MKLTLEGVPNGSLVIGGERGPKTGLYAALRAVHRGGTIMVAAQKTTFIEKGQQQEMYPSRLSETGEEQVRFHEETMTIDFTNPHFVEKDLLPSFFFANAVDSEGKVYTVHSWDEVRRLNALIDASLVKP